VRKTRRLLVYVRESDVSTKCIWFFSSAWELARFCQVQHKSAVTSLQFYTSVDF